jgi:SagB-type dehydrogenase family enzyme
MYLYEPVPHALSKLRIADQILLEQFLVLVDGIVQLEEATIIWFGAQFGRTLSKYENGDSLVWRDAGALLMTISLVAEFLGLNCCALGITGEPSFSRILESREKVSGVGGLLIGDR